MRVRVRVEGHQHYRETEGEVLLFSQGIERLNGINYQVPCIVLRGNDGVIETISLQQERRWVKVEELK